ncbi:hypothetical protein ABID20_003452 [Rhizobium alvei]|uniref:hypothetical protein n=1 Tax=Rhizobium alvei TaxID=1132659 RepID=UPI0033926543
MKIGLPKIRLSRKLLFIVLGMTVLLGGTGAAALYIGSDAIMGKPAENVAGEACTTIQTMVLKTPARRLWLRKYIRMENADGEMRIKTALRIAGLAAKAYQVDLIQVNVLDAKGPATRAEMRGRAIGAEVLIAMNPRYLPQMKSPFVARYFDGQPTAEGRFYGDRVSLDLEDVQKMMGKMKDAPDKVDCAEPEKPAEDAEADKNAHGEKKKEGHEAKPAANDHGKPANEHGEAAKENAHGEQPAEGDKAADHGEPAKEGEHPAEAAAEEPGFLDSVLGMIGLGGSEEKPASEHGETAADTSGEHAAPAEGHAAPAEDHAAPTEDHAAPAENHAAPAEDHAAPAEDHAAPAEDHAAPAEDHAAPAEDHAAPTEDHAAPAENHAAPAEDHAAPAEDHAAPAEDHAAPAEDHAAPAEDHAAPAKDHTAPAKDHAAPAEDHAAPAKDHAAPAEDHAAPAEDHAAPAEDHAAPADHGGQTEPKPAH